MAAYTSQPLPPSTTSIVVPGEGEYLAEVRRFVFDAARSSGFGTPEAGTIELAVSEACANIIEHGYNAGPRPADADIRVEVSVHADHIAVAISDSSPLNFPVDRHPIIDLDEYFASGRRRGLGMYIVRTFMDEVSHSFEPGHGNRLTLVKYLAPPRGADAPLAAGGSEHVGPA